MTDEIRLIIDGYIQDGDYEKALSLLTKCPIDNAEDQALLEKCQKEFINSCTSTITEAVKNHDKTKAEQILASYIKLVGEDTNTTLFQTLIQNITPSIATKPQKKVGGRLALLKNKVFEICTPDTNFLQSKLMRYCYITLILLTVLCAWLINDPKAILCLLTMFISVALVIPTLYTPKSKLRLIKTCALVIPMITVIVTYGDGVPEFGTRTLTWVISLIYIWIFNTLLANESKRKRIIKSILLWTIFNPIWYSIILIVYVSISEHWTRPVFMDSAIFWFSFATLVTLCIYWSSLVGLSTVKQDIITHKKKIIIALGIFLGLFVTYTVGMNIKRSHDEKIAQEQWAEKMRQDAIRQAEEARRAAIEQARQDSLAAIRRKEQARRDSIDYAEHAGFVAKYSKLGLIITELEMTRGTNDKGVPTKGIKFTVFNPTHKTIKYVIANMYAVNHFNDRMTYNERCRGIGPVDPHEYGSWSFEDIFPDKNDVIDDLSVGFEIIYTNGSSKTIRWKDAYVSDFKTSWFEGR